MKFVLNMIILMIVGFIAARSQTPENYFKIAAENNPGLQAKYKEFEAVLQKIPQVSSLPDPTVSFGYFISPVETRVGPQRAKLSLTQMFPWFGTLKAQGDVAALMAEARYQLFMDARNQLFYQVAAAYYPLYELNRLKQIEQENIDILQSYKAITISKYKNGTAPMVDVLRVDIMLKDATTSLTILNQNEKPLRTTFNKLLNRDIDEEVSIIDSLAAELLPPDFRKDSLLTGNPVLDALDLKIKASKASEIAAQKQGLPRVGVGLDWVVIGERPDMDMADNGKDVLMPMVSLSIPLFRKKYDAAQKEAQLMHDSYLLQKSETENSLLSDYETAWFKIQQHKQLISLYDLQIQTSQQSLNLLFASYENSGNEFEEVLNMQQQLLEYKKMKATAEVQLQIALARLNYITAKDY